MGTFVESFGAGEAKQLPGDAFLRVLTTAAPIDIAFYNSKGGLIETVYAVESGFVRRSPFHSFIVTSASAQSVKFWTSSADNDYDRIVGDVNVIPAGSVVALADVTILAAGNATIPANPDRKELHLFASGDIKVGTGAGAAAGLRIKGNMVAALQCDGALYIYNPGAGAITVEISELV